MASFDIVPCETVYVQNLNENIKKEELKKALYAAFSPHGTILDVVAMKTNKMRGQAFIVYSDIASATNAVRTMQGFVFLDKPMRVSYAKSKSDAVMKASDPSYARQKQEKRARTGKASGADGDSRPAKRAAGSSAAASSAPVPAMPEVALPNNILFVEGPPEISDDDGMLPTVFGSMPGFVEVRKVPSKKGLAFVEYVDTGSAAFALSHTNGFRVTADAALRVTYAKK